jgi:PAS domain S-box-containing protein
MTVIAQLLDVPSIDPEDARRRKLLNIILLSLLAVDVFALLLSIVVAIAAGEVDPALALILIGSTVMLVGIGIIFAVNRYRSGLWASASFLLLLTFVFAFSDVPEEVIDGRSLFLFTVPIIMASVLLQPFTSFLVAGLSGAIIAYIAIVQVDTFPNVPAIIGFFAVALVSWLSARSLERALEDLRAINRELDQRVVERTQDLQQALSRVQAESSKSQAILESIADGVIVFDPQGQATVANHAIAYLLNQPSAQITGMAVEALLRQNGDENPEREKIIRFVRDRQSRGNPRARFEWGEKTLSVSVATVRDDTNQSAGTVVVFRDYTREAEVDRMKSAFVSMVSHELRTPLNAIIGYGDMLKEQVYGPLSEGQRETVQRVMANGQRMLGLVNNLLDQAQIEAGKVSVHTSPFEINDLIADLSSVMSVLAKQKGLELECSVAADMPERLISDRHRLHQVLVNLVGNAIKFTQQGKVSIRAFRRDTSHWSLEVADTGPGIPKEAQSYVFDPFRRVDESVTRQHEGTGLGLSIVKQLVGLLGGEITLTSEVGHGSVFTVVLPLVVEQESQKV